MRLYDITTPLRPGMPVYPGDSAVRVRPTAQIDKGDPFNLLLLSMGSHAGTHVDAPYHFEAGGLTVDQLPLETLYGPALVRDVGRAEVVDEAALEALALPAGTRRLLLKSRNSRLWEDPAFRPDFVALTPGGARWLVERGLGLVGVDYLSIEPLGSPEFPVHHTLLGAGVVIVEGLDLRGVPPGAYTLLCLPLRLAGGDGAPARVLLAEEQGDTPNWTTGERREP